jgi:hypothetical protein
MSADVVRDVASLRRLTVAQAASGVTLKIEGTVACRIDPPRSSCYIFHDGKEGVWCESHIGPLPVGKRVRVRGRSDEGMFAPELHVEAITVLPDAPPPVVYHRLTAVKLAAGAMDCQFVETEGIVMGVRRADKASGVSVVALMTDAGLLDIMSKSGLEEMRQLIDGRLKIRAVALSMFDRDRQFLSPIIRVIDKKDMEVISPPPDEEAIPMTALSDLLHFQPDSALMHRLKVRATVTAQLASGRLALSQGANAILVYGRGSEVRPGDEVEVLGFPKDTPTGAELEHATWKKLRSGVLPTPQTLVPPVQTEAHAQRVSLRGTVTSAPIGGPVLRLDIDGLDVPCRLFATVESRQIWPSLLAGTLVEVTGVCVLRASSTHMNARRRVESVTIFPQAPEDIRILASPPLSTEVMGYRIGLVLAFALALVGLVLWLRARRRLLDQRLRRERQDAVSVERQRLAHDLHDTLAQGLTALSVRLNAARKKLTSDPQRAEVHLDAADEQVRESLACTRQAIDSLRPSILQQFTLDQAIRKVASQLWPDEEVSWSVKSPSTLPSLPPLWNMRHCLLPKKHSPTSRNTPMPLWCK